MVKAFIDTNVLLDYLVPERRGHQDALYVFKMILEHKIEALITTQSVLDAAYIGQKYKDTFVQEFKNTIKHLIWRTNMSSIDAFQLNQALLSPEPDLEDNAQISCAYNECCDVFLTGDKALLARTVPKPMRIMTPSDFIAQCKG